MLPPPIHTRRPRVMGSADSTPGGEGGVDGCVA